MIHFFVPFTVVLSVLSVLSVLFRWATQRKVFGKPLISQPVIRNKLAAMIARVESVQSWLESVTYQMKNMVRLRLHPSFFLSPRLSVLILTRVFLGFT